MNEWATGVLTLGGVVLGSALTYLVDRLRQNRTEVLEARLQLGQAFEWIWPGERAHQRLIVNIDQLRARTQTLGVDDAFIGALYEAASACLADAIEYERQNPDDEDPRVDQDLVARYVEVVSALGVVLSGLLKPFGRMRLKKIVRRLKTEMLKGDNSRSTPDQGAASSD